MKLRPEQVTFIDGLRDALRTHRRVLGVLPTGGGKTVCFTHIAQVARGRVLILVHRRELVIQTVRHLLERGIVCGEHQRVHVSTIRSRTRFQPGLLIIDEAHHCTSRTWRARVEQYDVPTLGFTATPQRLDGRGLSEVFDDMVVGATVTELMLRGSLSRYRLFAPPADIDLSNVRTRGGDYARGELATAVDIPKVAYDALGNWDRFAAGRRTIAFCVSVAHAQHIAAAFTERGVSAAVIDGKMSPVVRQNIVGRFRNGQLTVLVSVDLVSEGFDVPACDCVLLLRPTQSLALYLQQVGRGLRPSGDDCVILDCVGNAGRHGLPDDERVWTLEGRKRRKGHVADVTCQTCPACLRVHRRAPRCPFCGHVHTVEAVVPESAPAVLSEVDLAAVRRARQQEVAAARTREQLEQIAAQRGYKPGWVDHIIQARVYTPRRWWQKD